MRERPLASTQFADEERELDDFMEHDIGLYRDMVKQSRAARQRIPGMTENEADALAEAQEIFGDVEGLLEQYKARKGRGGEAEEEEEEGQRGDRERGGAGGPSMVDPEIAKRLMVTEQDRRIRDTDLPEREQLRGVVEAGDIDLDEAAQWVAHELAQLPADHAVGRVLFEGAMYVHGDELNPDGPGSTSWRPGALLQGLTDTGGCRGMRLPRDPEGAEARRAELLRDAEARRELAQCVRSVLQDMLLDHMEAPAVATVGPGRCGELLAVDQDDLPLPAEAAVGRGEVDALAKRIGRVVEGMVLPIHRCVGWCCRSTGALDGAADL